MALIRRSHESVHGEENAPGEVQHDTVNPPHVQIVGAGEFEVVEPPDNPIGIYGWRKRCLYFFMLLLVVVIVVNLGLTIWILVVLDFNVHGMGDLRITDSGLRLEGTAEFIGPLYAQSIAADEDLDLTLQSQENVDISSGSSKLLLQPSGLNISTDSFQVYAQDQNSEDPLFSVSSGGVSVGADTLEARGTLGISVGGPVETSQIQSPSGGQLKLEAASGVLTMIGSQSASIETSAAGNIDVVSFGDIRLTASQGSIVLNTNELQFRDLPISSATSSGSAVYEVCVCENGRVYLVPATLSEGCEADGGICQP